MNTLILLAIALAGLLLVIGSLIWMALKGWRLAKRSLQVLDHVSEPVGDLMSHLDTLGTSANRLADGGQRVEENLSQLQASLARLQVLIDALEQAAQPYRKLNKYLGR